MPSAFQSWFIRFGFRIGIGILILVGFLYSFQKSNLQSSLEWVHHTTRVQRQIDLIEHAIHELQLNEATELEVQNLKKLTSDNPEQQKKIESLLEFFTRGEITIEIQRQMLALLAEMQSEESKLLENRDQVLQEQIQSIDLPLLAGGLFACLLIYLANRITRRDYYKLVQKEKEVQNQTKELRASRDRSQVQAKILSLTLESMAEGVILVNEHREYIQFNLAARRILGLEDANIHDPQVMAAFERRDPRNMVAIPIENSPISKAMRGESTSNLEIWVQSPNIDPKILSFNGRPIVDETGVSLGAIVVFRDVTPAKNLETELRKAEKSAKEASELKARFLANMSHEIRTPMNGIIGMTELLSHTRLDEKQQGFLTLIQESGQNLLTIINDILDFSKIEAGKLDIEKADFQLAYTIDRTVQLLAPKARDKSLVLLSYISPAIPDCVRGDAGRMSQILVNILSNAIKFTSSGKVVVWAELVSPSNHFAEVKVTIEDTGVGINTFEAQKLFLPFSQADASTSRKFGGTGLGLSICKQLVDLMGGQIGVQSKPGKGSKFWFTIPFERPLATKKDSLPKLPSDGEILIYDQDPLSAKILTDYISSWNLQTRSFDKSSELTDAISTVKDTANSKIFLVSTNQNLDAFETLVQSIASLKNSPQITLVLDQQDSETLQRFRTIGIENFLHRPIDQSSLYNHLMNSSSQAGTLDSFLKDTGSDAETVDLSSPFRILLAEDNSVNQLIAQAFLKELGMSVLTVANGKEVLEALRQSDFDLILMDCQMPEMDGFEATRLIRAQLSEELPIVALTANAMKGDEEKCLEAGMSGYLAKPFHKQQLQAILQKFLVPKGTPLFDVSKLEMLKGYQDENGEDLRKALIESYLKTTSEDFKTLDRLSGQDEEKFHRMAHTLKSSSASVGGTSLALLFESLENDHLSEQELKEKLSRVPVEFQNLKTHLDEYLKMIG